MSDPLMEQIKNAISNVSDRIKGYTETAEGFVTSVGKETNRLEMLIKRLRDCLEKLKSKQKINNWFEGAQSIMTTDTFPKYSSSSYIYEDSKIYITGIAKGSGMIAPNMATMLSFISSNINISKMEACLNYSNSFDEINKIIVGIDNLSQFKEILSYDLSKDCQKLLSLNCHDKMLINPSNWESL